MVRLLSQLIVLNAALLTCQGSHAMPGRIPNDIPHVNDVFDGVDISGSAKTKPVPAKQVKKFSRARDLFLRSHMALVYDERDQEVIFQRHADRVAPIASLTKLMTAMVILDAKLAMDEIITIHKKDKDRIRYSRSSLKFGTKLTRYDTLLLALLASENRAAAALARTFPGGHKAFVRAMNKKARSLGLKKTRFSDPAGLKKSNVSTARELIKLAKAAGKYPLIRYFTTTPNEKVTDRYKNKFLRFSNTNKLVRKAKAKFRLSKTGFTNDAGNCLIMQTELNGRPVTMVLLNSWGKYSKYGDFNRIRKWVKRAETKARKRDLAKL